MKPFLLRLCLVLSLLLTLVMTPLVMAQQAEQPTAVMETGPVEVIDPMAWSVAANHIKAGNVTEIEFIKIGGIVLVLRDGQKAFVHKPEVDVRAFVSTHAANAATIQIRVE